MKRLIIGLITLGAFVGGHQLGRRPDSTDLVGEARKVLRMAADAGTALAAQAPNARTTGKLAHDESRSSTQKPR
jgi:hypothetical protein